MQQINSTLSLFRFLPDEFTEFSVDTMIKFLQRFDSSNLIEARGRLTAVPREMFLVSTS